MGQTAYSIAMQQMGELIAKANLSTVALDEVNAQLAEMAKYIEPTGTGDDTSYIQSILDNYTDIVVRKGNYYIDAVTKLRVPSNRIIEWQEGAVFHVIPNSTDNYRVLEVQSVSNVTLINPQIVGDRDDHTGVGGESGHGIVMYVAQNIKIYNAVCRDLWGDGIVVGTACENILIDNVICDNNRRQGISLIDGRNVTISNSLLINTNGTAPQFGIDIEPTFDTAILDNIKVINTVTKNNEGGGININLTKIAGTGRFVDILIDNHVDEGSKDGLYFYKNPSGILGKIVCSKGIYKENANRGITFQNCSADSKMDVEVISPTIVDANTAGNAPGKYGAAIAFLRETAEVETYLMGNITIINPTIRDTRTPVKITRGIGMYDEKNFGYQNVKIIDPIGIYGLAQTALMDIGQGDVRVSDVNQVFTHDYSGINISMFDRVYTRLINPTEAIAKRTITLNQTYVSNYAMTIQNMSSLGVRVLPKVSATILPLSSVAGKYIESTQIGASITLRHISANVWYVENMIGTWTVEP